MILNVKHSYWCSTALHMYDIFQLYHKYQIHFGEESLESNNELDRWLI